MTSFISFKQAGFSYANKPVFLDVTLDIQQGKTLCLLGPNGCGKTTFIDALLGIHPLLTGDIFIKNQNIRALSQKQIARLLAYVPQKHVGYFSFSVLDVLLMGRCAYTSMFESPGKKDREKALEILEVFGLSHLRDRDYTRLSGGETQLIMIMRALVQDTPVIVMDEPTAHLDFKNELALLETISHLVKQENKTLIMATHFPNHAFYLENIGLDVDVAYLHEHKIHLAGPPTSALTPEWLETVYNVRAQIISCEQPQKGDLKQVVPIQTLE